MAGRGRNYDQDPGYDSGYTPYIQWPEDAGETGYPDQNVQWDNGWNSGYSASEPPGYDYDWDYSRDSDWGEGEDDTYSESPWDDSYNQSDYVPPLRPIGQTMASRATGKRNNELYGGARHYAKSAPSRPAAPAYEYDSDYPRRRPRKKKRHGFRNFLVFLLVLAVIIAAAGVLLFRPPEQTESGGHVRKQDVYNILLCATDEGGLRTDTIMILTLKKGEAALTSLPRDTIVSSGDAVPKLNGVYASAGGGAAGALALEEAAQTLLGFRVDGYMIIGYEVFRDAVDALGGVKFEVPMDMEVDDPETGETMYISAGEQLLDGAHALGVCRYRHGYLMADVQRQYVQQSFVKAAVKQCLSPTRWGRLPAVYNAVIDHVETDLSPANLRYVVWRVLGGARNIQQNTLPGEGVTYNGASCYGLFGQSTVDMVNAVMNPYEEEITLDDVYILTVSNGTLVESTWSGTAFDASSYDYQ